MPIFLMQSWPSGDTCFETMHRLYIKCIYSYSLSFFVRGVRFGWKDSQIEALRWIIELLSWHRAEVSSLHLLNVDHVTSEAFGDSCW